MARSAPNKTELRSIENLLAEFDRNRDLIIRFLNQLRSAIEESKALAPYIHSLKSRVKDREHLRNKLNRKFTEAKQGGKQSDVKPDNLLIKITDLAGIRILHLYTRQISPIDTALREILKEQQWDLLEGPFARTWDDESREFFNRSQIQTQDSESMYTSVHYIVGSASRTKITCEIQVRTLMEEVWGEVDHALNYPKKSDSVACQEQIKVLARATSTATRLVDSIFATDEEFQRQAKLSRSGKRLTSTKKQTK